MDFIEQIGFARIHVFPYSRREGTKAAQLSDLPASVKQLRAHELIALGKKLEHKYMDGFIGTNAEVLFEDCDAQGNRQGLTGTYIHVRVQEDVKSGDIRRIKLLSREGDIMRAELI